MSLQEMIEAFLTEHKIQVQFSSEEVFLLDVNVVGQRLTLKKQGERLTLAADGKALEYQVSPYHSEWNPCQTILGDQLIPIVVKYEGRPAYSGKAMAIFTEYAEELAELIGKGNISLGTGKGAEEVLPVDEIEVAQLSFSW